MQIFKFFWHLLSRKSNFLVNTFLINYGDNNSLNFRKNRLKKEIKFILVLEKERMNTSVELFVENIIQEYNKKFVFDQNNLQIVFKLENVYFYDNMKELNESIYDCVGENENVEELNYDSDNSINRDLNFHSNLVGRKGFKTTKNNCRKSKLKDIPMNIIYLLSSSNFNMSNYSNKMEINPCKTRYFADIYSEIGLFPEIELSINDWISNLVGHKINISGSGKLSSKKIAKDLRKCMYLNEDDSGDVDYTEDIEINDFNTKIDSGLPNFSLRKISKGNARDSENGYRFFKGNINGNKPKEDEGHENRNGEEKGKEEKPAFQFYKNSINSNRISDNYSKKKVITFN